MPKMQAFFPQIVCATTGGTDAAGGTDATGGTAAKSVNSQIYGVAALTIKKSCGSLLIFFKFFDPNKNDNNSRNQKFC